MKRTKRQFLKILFEDKDILVIDKPVGILSEPKSDSPHGNLLEMIHGYFKRKFKGSKGSYVKLVHRLDKDTSGVIVVATSKAGEALEDQFRNHQIERYYTAIVEGAVDSERGKIDFPLEKGEFGFGRKVRVAEGEGGKKAVTFFEVIERYANASLLRVSVQTGRTHQVRVHLSKIGHPLVGDTIYGARNIPFKRQALHASFLSLIHPRTGKRMRFDSKLPKDMTDLVDHLRGN